jgi:hypothetical protein
MRISNIPGWSDKVPQASRAFHEPLDVSRRQGVDELKTEVQEV